jgi:hypothetical protein
MRKQPSFSVEQITILCDLNRFLEKQTGIHFVNELIELANNERKTEIDAREFIKKHYPVKNNLTPENVANLSILLDFYLYKVDIHDLAEEGVTFCSCEAKKSAWDDNFRAPSMNVFLQNKSVQEKSMYAGFFPLS